MEMQLLKRIRHGLQETRDSLSAFLNTTPADNKAIHLGPSPEAAVRDRLEVIDRAISQADARTLGKCTICRDEVEPVLLEVDYTARVCIEHFSAQERRQLENELNLARDIQKMLLPQELPRIPNLEVAAYSRPSQIVGGDYFDFVRFGNGHQGLMIADVAGHGVSASMLVASLQAFLRTITPTSNSPAEVVRQIHKLLIHNIRYKTFASFFIGAFDPANGTLTFCNAGHPPQLLFRNGNRKEDDLDLLMPTGAAVGLVEEADFGEKTIELDSGDTLVLYTDGVTEAENGRHQRFGREALAELIRGVDSNTAGELVSRIKCDLQDFSEGRPLPDDVTIVVSRVTS
ncbi:MAG: PP2C family protein-serine/threonine phosphatase [Desulfobacterales bacterium]